MTKYDPLRIGARGVRLLCAVLFLFYSSTFTVANAAGGMTLLTEPTSTRAIALESTTLKGEPFPLNAPVAFGSDNRTRLIFFAMNLDLLAGEGLNAFSADAVDAAKNSYALMVEDVRPVPGFEWMSAITVRLADNMGDPGETLVRINLHGVASNRVRVAIGHTGGASPVDDTNSMPMPAPASAPAPTPTPTPNPYTGAATTADTVRMLEQATWGPTTAEVTRVQALGFRAFLNEQFNAQASGYPSLAFPLDDQNQQCPAGATQADCNRDNYSLYPIQRTFFTNALYSQDQLRQRVAFALHQIFVVSGRDLNRPSWMTNYLQILDRNAFGNFRTLLQEMTLNPEMGEYLDMRLSTRTSPNENFAREILQLFSIGVDELNLDGTPKRDAQGNRIPSYTQNTVNEFTRVFTGWNLTTAIGAGITNYRDPMVVRSGNNHDVGAKFLLNGGSLAACTSGNATCAQQDLNSGLDNIFNHPNVGPFIGKQLIQHLVTSNPSPAYVQRVASVFNNNCAGLYPENCTGARGDLKAVVRAILLDPEARGDAKTAPDYGKLREPVQYINNVLRAFNAKSFDKSTTSDGVLGSRSSTDFLSTMDQPLFQPATVFSYYTPDYEVPGTGILGPAFNILSTSTTLRRVNYVNSILYSGVTVTTGTNTDRPRGTALDTAAFEAIMANTQVSDSQRISNLMDALNSLLMHGTMSAQMRSSIITAISTIPTTDAAFARKRTQMAIYLVTTSTQYQVQR